jgi:hypothetical protein
MPDPYEALIFQTYTKAEIQEIQILMTEWDAATRASAPELGREKSRDGSGS